MVPPFVVVQGALIPAEGAGTVNLSLRVRPVVCFACWV